MDEFAQLQAAIDELADDLPGLVGEDWPTFKGQLDGYLQQGGSNPDVASIMRALMLALFASYPAAHTQLIALMDIEVTRSFQSASAPAPDPSPVVVTRYTDISCPNKVWVETARISVVVRLTMQPVDASAVSEEMQVRTDAPVLVQIEAPQFEILNDARQPLTVHPDQDSAPIVFDLRPLTVGPTQISFDFWQSGAPLRTVTVDVEISATEVSADVDMHAVQPLRMDPSARPPDRVLHIAWDGDEQQLCFSLIQEGGAWWRTFPPVQLNGDPAAHAAQLFRRIATLVDSNDPTAAAVLDAENWIAPKDVDRRIKRMGQHLWENLIPPDLRRHYAAERDNWTDRSLLLLADEPHLPWELIWPYDLETGEWEDEGPWCATTRMTRWLRKDARGVGAEMAPARLRSASMAVIAPTYARLDDLPGAQAEEDALLGLIEARGVQSIGPDMSEWGPVMDFLEAGDYDWVHFAAHGNFYPEAPGGDSALWLAADVALTPEHLAGPAIVRHLRQQRPGFFFNACEVGRQGWSLTQLGGWANRLVSLGAGLFVGPLWAVSDDGAFLFADVFYRSLLDGETVASATHHARLAARAAGDPTWLAYSVYAHPNARIQGN